MSPFINWFMETEAYAGKNFRGFKVMTGLVGGPWGRAPRTPGNFRKFAKKISVENCKKCIIVEYFSKFFYKPCINFSRVWTKNTNCWEILRNFWKFSKYFFRKFRIIHYFSIVFEKLNKPCVKLSCAWTKTTNCTEILSKFWKFLMKIQ